MKRVILLGAVVILWFLTAVSWCEWRPHTVVLLNGDADAVKVPSQFQIITEKMSRVVLDTYMEYMPEKDRLIMLVTCDYPYHGAVIFSDDHGATWSEPKFVHLGADGNPDVLESTALTYLGDGKALLVADRKGSAAGKGQDGAKRDSTGPYLWFSTDYGETWGNPKPLPLDFWDRFFVDRDAKTGRVDRIIAGSYAGDSNRWYRGSAKAPYANGGLMISTDEGHTWSSFRKVPQWTEMSEINFMRAANGDLVAAGRMDWPDRLSKQNADHNEGMGVSVSKDNGQTWSEPLHLYSWGHHHPSMALLPNGDLVMTYVVRKGYPHTIDNIPQFGVEAIVSHDNGETWDLDHRYILARWPGLTKGPNSWLASPQGTSTVLMPDGSLLTSFGTGYRSLDPSLAVHPAPRDIGLISWRESEAPLNPDRRITNAPWDSDRRNEYNPDPDRREVRSECPAAPGKKIISVAEDGAVITSSAIDDRPEYLLHNPYIIPVLTLESMPAWVEIRWPEEHNIDEIHILPGAPEWVNRASNEEVPLDYCLQYEKGGRWQDLAPPVTNAQRYRDFNNNGDKRYIFTDVEFEYIHKFSAVRTKAIRMTITRSSDSGMRWGTGSKVVVPEDKRETAIRSIEVFEANSRAAASPCREQPLRAIEISEPK